MPRADSTSAAIPAGAVVRFIGDVHLGDGASNDLFGRRDELLAAFLSECAIACDAVVFMGDAFDLPQAFTPRRIVRAHPVAIRAIADLCQRIPVYFVRGNHDWTVDYEKVFDGARADETLVLVGAQVMHGHQLDRYCCPEQRSHRAKVTAHHLVERLFGFQFRVPLHAHDTWQNRLAHWLGAGYGRFLRRQARICRRLGIHVRAEACEAFIHYWSRAVWGDHHALFGPVSEALRTSEIDALVCGHTHLPGVVRLGPRTYVNAGSWAFGAAQYAEWTGSRFEVRDAASGACFTDQSYRWMQTGADPGDFFSWWALHHEGGLRFRRFPTSQRGPRP